MAQQSNPTDSVIFQILQFWHFFFTQFKLWALSFSAPYLHQHGDRHGSHSSRDRGDEPRPLLSWWIVNVAHHPHTRRSATVCGGKIHYVSHWLQQTPDIRHSKHRNGLVIYSSVTFVYLSHDAEKGIMGKQSFHRHIYCTHINPDLLRITNNGCLYVCAAG